MLFFLNNLIEQRYKTLKNFYIIYNSIKFSKCVVKEIFKMNMNYELFLKILCK